MPRKRDRTPGLPNDFGKLIEASIRDTLRSKVGGPLLPDGIVTIVFTDVEGSTQLVRDLGDAPARELLRRHDEIVREVVAEQEGHEVERAGDAFMLAFRLPTKAVTFALDLHDRLGGDGDIRVRIGMDTGEVIREEKGYFGRTVIRAARVAQLAEGGHVFVSEATKVLADIDTATTFVDLGDRELDGLGGSHRVFEAVRAGPGP